ncbi:MAG: TonB-dependent siderophore receptor [Verrucomicrobia bacterium]|nr:TonB-dependent siderophore receptor [Verrucomicrobiota bacterium]
MKRLHRLAHIFMVCGILVPFLGAADGGPKIAAQAIIEQMTADHPDLITAGIHAKPANSRDYVIIAHSLHVSIGHKSEGADLVTLETGKPDGPNALEGWIYDIGLPLRDRQGAIFAFVAFHVKPDPKGPAPKDEALRRAEKYRDELQARIPDSAALFEPAVSGR